MKIYSTNKQASTRCGLGTFYRNRHQQSWFQFTREPNLQRIV